MMMCERGVISNGGQEVKMAITPMEETVTESPYCKDLEPVSRQRYKQLINKYVCRDPYLIKKSEFSVEPKDLPTIKAVPMVIKSRPTFIVLQTKQMYFFKGFENSSL